MSEDYYPFYPSMSVLSQEMYISLAIMVFLLPLYVECHGSSVLLLCVRRFMEV
jgi:hypothetical protein